MLFERSAPYSRELRLITFAMLLCFFAACSAAGSKAAYHQQKSYDKARFAELQTQLAACMEEAGDDEVSRARGEGALRDALAAVQETQSFPGAPTWGPNRMVATLNTLAGWSRGADRGEEALWNVSSLRNFTYFQRELPGGSGRTEKWRRVRTMRRQSVRRFCVYISAALALWDAVEIAFDGSVDMRSALLSMPVLLEEDLHRFSSSSAEPSSEQTTDAGAQRLLNAAKQEDVDALHLWLGLPSFEEELSDASITAILREMKKGVGANLRAEGDVSGGEHGAFGTVSGSSVFMPSSRPQKRFSAEVLVDGLFGLGGEDPQMEGTQTTALALEDAATDGDGADAAANTQGCTAGIGQGERFRFYRFAVYFNFLRRLTEAQAAVPIAARR